MTGGYSTPTYQPMAGTQGLMNYQHTTTPPTSYYDWNQYHPGLPPPAGGIGGGYAGGTTVPGGLGNYSAARIAEKQAHAPTGPISGGIFFGQNPNTVGMGYQGAMPREWFIPNGSAAGATWGASALSNLGR